MKQQTKCPVCSTNSATLHPSLGVLPCSSCQSRRNQNKLPRQFEVITENLRQDRKEHARSIIQPFRNGELSKEYVDNFGTKGISVTPEEVKNAKNQWTDIHNPDNFNYKKSK